MIKLKEYKKYFKYVLAIILGIILWSLILWNRTPKYKWPEDMIIPKPYSKYGEVEKYLDGSVNASISKIDSEMFFEYVEALISDGFTIDKKTSNLSFEAFNNDGYKISVSFYDTSEEMTIDLDVPIVFNSTDISNLFNIDLVPEFNLEKVNIKYQRENSFDIYVGNYDLKAYSDYVNKCISKGYTLNFDRNERYFKALNSNGDILIVKYIGFNIIEIDFEKGETNSSSNVINSGNENNNKSENNNSNKVSTTFKELMDEYEEFFDKYISFMKKYNSTENITIDMINDYSEFLKEYSDYMDKLSKAQPKDLTSEDYKYYLEVYTRIIKKIEDM